MYRVRELGRAAVSLLLPNRCPFCNEIVGADRYWCGRCYEELPFLEKHQRPVSSLDGLYSCCVYRDRAMAAVHRMKSGFYGYAAEAFAVLMTELSGDITERIDLVTSVPTSFRRRMEIGYDHTARIARDVAGRRRLRYRRLLKSVGNRQEQKRLGRKQRFENVRGAYKALNRSAVAGKNILLIDDVSTTGATLSAAAAALKEAGAAKVFGLTFARTLCRCPESGFCLPNNYSKELTYDK